MENNNLNENNLLEKENIFIPDYFNQNIQNNNKFKTWENLMLQKYGSNARLFKCTVDKIYFYISDKDCMEYPYYSSYCPICKNVICYFCLRNSTYIRMEFCKCCIRRRLYYLFHLGSQEYINPIGPLKDYADKFESGIIIYLVPFLNMIFTIGAISSMFFIKCIFFMMINLLLMRVELDLSIILLSLYFLFLMHYLHLHYQYVFLYTIFILL